MPRFQYQAYNQNGDIVSGEIEAADQQSALSQISSKGLIPYKTTASEKADTKWWEIEVYSFKTISTEELSVFTRELATLLETGIPVDEALRIIATQSSSQRIKKFNARLLEKITAGASFSVALEEYKEQIPHYYSSLVKVGEASGSLGSIFSQLATFIEHSEDIKSRIRSALVYPILLLVLSIAAIILIAAFLIPGLAPIFENSKADVPFFISASLWVQNNAEIIWPISLATLVMLILVITIGFRSPQAKMKVDALLLRVPVIGKLIQDNENGKIVRALAMLLSNGMPLLQALNITKNVTGNHAFSFAMQQAAGKLKEGRSLYDTFSQTGVFTDIALRLVRIGEQSGKLDDMLFHCARILESQTQRKINRIMTWFSPVLTLLIGLGIGGIIMSVMNAILSVNELAFS